MTDNISRLRALDVCAVSDALDALKLPCAVTILRRLSGNGVLAGKVVTVELAVGSAPDNGPKTHLGARAIGIAGPGDVIVVAHPGIDAGGWGGVLSNGAQVGGVAGVVVDGPVRDVDEANALGFPLFGRGTTARTARGRVHEVSTGKTITLAGIRVEPGDFLIADGSGVALVPQSQIDAVLSWAERIATKERLMTNALRDGQPAVQVLGADYENMLENKND